MDKPTKILIIVDGGVADYKSEPMDAVDVNIFDCDNWEGMDPSAKADMIAYYLREPEWMEFLPDWVKEMFEDFRCEWQIFSEDEKKDWLAPQLFLDWVKEGENVD